MKMPPMLETVIRPAPESAHMARWLAPVGRRIVFWLLLAATATACASAKAPMESLHESSGAPIPLRAGYWVQMAFHDARFEGGSEVCRSATSWKADWWASPGHFSRQRTVRVAGSSARLADRRCRRRAHHRRPHHGAGPGGDRGQADHDSPDAMACVRQGRPGAVVGGGGHPAARVLPGPAVPQAVRGASRARALRDGRSPDAISAMAGARFEMMGLRITTAPKVTSARRAC